MKQIIQSVLYLPKTQLVFKKALFISFLILSLFTGRAQTYAVIGTASSTSSTSGPTTSTLSGPRTERHTAIYTSAELSAGGLSSGSILLGIAWDKSGAGSYAGNDLSINIYLKHTTAVVFAANPTYATEISTATQVYATTSGTIPATTGFIQFTFNSNSFVWNGTDNIQVITEIIRPGDWENTTFSWRTLASVTNAGANVSGNPPAATLTRTGIRPQVRFEVATAGNDAALTAMPSPVSAPPGTQNIDVVIRNVGTTTLTTADIGWKINSSAITNFSWTGSLVPGASTIVTIASPLFATGIDTITATVTKPNGATDGGPGNNTVSKIVQICNTLSGAFTINNLLPTTGANFNSFNDFAKTLTNCGISGNVVATVDPASGPYREQVVFQNIAGLGAGATITIKGNNRTITSDTAILSGGSNPNRYIIRLTGLQYFTIDSLAINMVAGSTAFIGIHALNSGNNINIRNCTVDMGTGTSTLLAAVVFNGAPGSILTPGGTFNTINVTGNSFSGGGYGVSVVGLAPPLATIVTISNNTFTDFYDNGVYLRETDGATINNNRFNKIIGDAGIVNAIQYAQAANINGRVFSNKIKMTQSNGSMRGIYLFAGTGHKVYNNVISNEGSIAGNLTGITVRATASAPEISFNTISFDYAGTSSGELFGIEEELSNTNSVLRNNIISISQPTTNIRSALVLGATSTVTTALNSNYNIFYVPDSSIAIRNSTTPTKYRTLAAWQAASGQDANSLEADPKFISPSLFIPTNPLLNNTGIAIAGITTDILGVTRSATPDPGAYEISLPVIYTFVGAGNWNIPANWSPQVVPPSPLPAGSEIIINPTGGDCILNVPYTVGPGGKLTVKNAKNFIIQGNLILQ